MPFIFHTGNIPADLPALVERENLGPVKFLQQPVLNEKIVAVVRQALEEQSH